MASHKEQESHKLELLSFQDIDAEPTEFLWCPYIPRGKITILQGDPGDGKTTLALAIASAISKGQALPGEAPLGCGNILFQTAEDGLADTIKPRLEQLGANCSRIYTIKEEERPLSFLDARIEEAIVKVEADLLIIDPLQAYIGSANMGSAGAMRPLLSALGAVAERTECAILILGHLNKSNQKIQYRSLGSIDIFAAVRSVLTVRRLNEKIRFFEHTKSNLAPTGVAQAFSFDPDMGFVWHGEADVAAEDIPFGKTPPPKPESQMEKAKRFLQTKLANGPMRAIEIERLAQEAGISKSTLNRAKTELGIVPNKQGTFWVWQLPIEVDFEDCQDDQTAA